jgi:APA family basic amino acid/polyamine antiporter
VKSTAIAAVQRRHRYEEATTKLNVDAPVAVALDMHPQLSWLSAFVKVGAIAGMTSVILMSLLGQPRILLAMADDGLLPPVMSRCHPRFKTPHIATVVTGVAAALFAGLFPLDVLGELISIGILLAFAVVCIGVLVLRRTRPNEHRPFRVPFAPVTCTAGTLVCLAMTLALPKDTWWRLLVWTAAGFSIYALYGYRHSRLRDTHVRDAGLAAKQPT